MTRARLSSLVAGAAAVSLFAACDPDLNVTNPNAPDVARAIATPGDVRQLIGSSYATWFHGMQGCAAPQCEPVPGLATAVMADNMTMSFGNFGARFNGQEPRLAYNNSSAANDGRVASSPYDAMYGALGAANDGLNAIKRGIKVAANKSAPDETPQMQALAYLVQGLSLGFEALVFDKGFIILEDTDNTTATLQPYAAVNTAALASIDKAIAAAAGKTWSIPSEFTPGMNLTAAKFTQMANTMAARQIAYLSRTPTENAAANWAKVLQYADKGISTGASFDLQIQGDGGNNWLDVLKGYGELESWVRLDQRVVQLADPTQPLLYLTTTPPPMANPVDKRFARGTPNAAGDIKEPGADFWFYKNIPFAAARGTYFFSQWAHARYIEFGFEADAPFLGIAPYVLAAENDLLIAEALVRTNGDKGRAATLINKTRVGRGGLPALSGASSNNDLLAAIFYERDVELFDTGAGQAWFDRRRIDTNLTYNGIPIGNTWGFRGGSNLQKGTPRHLPVPAKELETLGLPVYTYGGNAPNPIFPEM
ncbi:MAG TPA: RagB/SusD family nutrient uptake outer membrane protein [Gemmatimonadaceae bacterium]|nr:RagB/SusD family nutrient uptake outer membrane protein [Gemmatimonadaceae bacterium]